MEQKVDYKSPTEADYGALRSVAMETFSDTFVHLYDPIPFAAFLDETYGDGGRMERDLADPSIRWQIALVDDHLIGYAELSRLLAPAANGMPGALELQQIYVLRKWHGQGIADRLMQWALDVTRTDNAPEIYLTVLDQNERAKRLYTRYGFVEVGHCTFQMGDHIDDDRVWRKQL